MRGAGFPKETGKAGPTDLPSRILLPGTGFSRGFANMINKRKQVFIAFWK
jgi:hypothetical protein